MNDNRDDELNNQSMGAKSPEVAFKEGLKSAVPEVHTPDAVLASVRLQMDEGADAEALNVETLLAEVRGHLDVEKIDALIDACQRECLQMIVRPFGVGRVLFEDKDGGNVTTIHNMQKGLPPADQKDTYVRDDYTGNGSKYDSAAKNHKSNFEQKHGQLFDEATGQPTNRGETDHIVSTSEFHKSGGFMLPKEKKQAFATDPENFQILDKSPNASKGDNDPKEWVKKNKDRYGMDERRTNPRIRRGEATKRKHLPKLAEKAEFYLKGSARTGVKEGGKMALQQALGVLMEEFVRASFEEIRDVWRNGFKGAVDDAFLDVLKARLMRVVKRVQSKWKDAAYALRDGFFSGFLSNLVTVLINTFATTLKRYVRMIREGFMSLYRATKTLAFPDEGVSTAEAADAALKIIAAGLVTAGGIAIEGALAPYLEPLQAFDPLSEIVLAASVGLVTGLATACTVYWLDKADIFGVQEKANKQKVIERLTATIQISHERALEAAAIFDGPALPHLS